MGQIARFCAMEDKPEPVDRKPVNEIGHLLGREAPQKPGTRTAAAALKFLKAVTGDLAALGARIRHSLTRVPERSTHLLPASRPGFRRSDQIVDPYPLRPSSRHLGAAVFQNWLLLAYKVPSEPVAGRVAVWRRLKSMGGIYLQDNVCLLPKTDDHVRRLKLLENHIAAIGGEAVILEAVGPDRAQRQKVVGRFKADRDEAYCEFIAKCEALESKINKDTTIQQLTYAKLEEHDVDLNKLRDWLDKLCKLDFYGGALAAQASQRLLHCENLLEIYARSVFEAHEPEPIDPISATS
jgi:hypothetical protein